MFRKAMTTAGVAAICIGAVPLSAQAPGVLTIDLEGQQYALKVTGCRVGDEYYLIDAEGEAMTFSLVGALAGDQTYTTMDFFYVAGGEDRRAGASVPAIPLQDGAFAYDGPVQISDQSDGTMRVTMAGC